MASSTSSTTKTTKSTKYDDDDDDLPVVTKDKLPATYADEGEDLVIHETVGDEQRARSAEMEAAGGPEAWMKMQAGATGATGPTGGATGATGSTGGSTGATGAKGR